MVKRLLFMVNGLSVERDVLCTSPKGEYFMAHNVKHEFPYWACVNCGMVFQIIPTTPNGNKLNFDFEFDQSQIKN